MTEDEMKPFCSTDDPLRYEMRRPFVQFNWRYATDARIMIRCPAPGEPDSVCEYGFPPNLGRTQFNFPTPSQTHEMPPPHGLAMLCENCNGIGERDCDHCGGGPCGDCLGRGTVPVPQEVFGVWISVEYIALLRSLQGLRVFPIPGRGTCLGFTFDGGEGRVMGMEAKHAEKCYSEAKRLAMDGARKP